MKNKIIIAITYALNEIVALHAKYKKFARKMQK